MMRALIRHLVASFISVSWPPVIAFFAYFGLLLIAVLFDKGIGGPMALPFMVISAAVLGVGATFFILMPSVVSAEIIARRFHWNRLFEIPGSVAIMTAVTAAFSAIGVQFILINVAYFEIWAWSTAVLLVPLGIYWWCAKVSQLILTIMTQIWQGFRRVLLHER